MTEEESVRAEEVYRIAYNEARAAIHPLSVGPDGGHAKAHRAAVVAVFRAGGESPGGTPD